MAVGTPTTSTGSGSPITIAVPAGMVAGNIVLLVVSIDNPATTILAWPSGFVQLNQHSITADGQNLAVAYKRLTGADSGTYTVTLNGLGGTGAAAIPLTGRHATNPPVLGTVTDQNTAVTGTTNTITATGLTALLGDDILHISLPDVTVANIGAGHSAWGLGTEIVDLINAGSGWCNIGVAKLENVAAGATGNKAVTFTKTTTGGAGWSTFLVRVPVAPSGPHNIAVGQQLETDTPQPIGRRKSKTLGQVTETETPQAIGRRHSRTAGQETETDTPQPIARRKSKTLGQLTEADSVFSITRLAPVITRNLGQLTETDTAQPIGRRHLRTLGQVTEADAVFSIIRFTSLTRTLGLLTDAETLQPLRSLKRITLGQPNDVESLTHITSSKRRGMGQVTELDVVFTVSKGAKIRTLGLLATDGDVFAIDSAMVPPGFDPNLRPRYYIQLGTTIKRRAL